jgi:hypothetical protein
MRQAKLSANKRSHHFDVQSLSSQDEVTKFGDTGPFSPLLVDLEGIDFNVDMFGMNYSVTDILAEMWSKTTSYQRQHVPTR